MNPSNPFLCEVSAVSFSFYSAEQIRQISVKKIHSANAFDPLGHPTEGGLYDLALGPFDKKDTCRTCGLTYFACPGHFGHVELPLPVYNPVTFATMYRLLRSLCLFCWRLRTPPIQIHTLASKLKLLHASLPFQAVGLDGYIESRVAAFNSVEDFDDEGDETTEGTQRPSKKKARISQSDIMEWIDEYVAEHLSVFDGSQYRPHKSTASAAQFQNVLRSFFSSAPNTCSHCKAQSPSLRKEGFIKIFERGLSEKVRRRNEAKGLSRAAGTAPPTPPNASSKNQSAKREPVSDDEEGDDAEAAPEDGVDMEDADDPTEAKAAEPISSITSGKDTFLTPHKVRTYLRNLWAHKAERTLLNLLYGSASGRGGAAVPERISTPDIFFLDVVPVAPTRFRPASKMNDMTYDNPQNTVLAKILRTCELMMNAHRSSMATGPDGKALSQESDSKPLGAPAANSVAILPLYIALQATTNSLIDSTKSGTNAGAKGVANGIRQVLEKKEGLFRMHMMGKRVNYAGRSVISPDVNIETGEVGIPPFFATRLTYPTPVTAHNLGQLRRAVINGPLKWPGATHVVMENGSMVSLAALDETKRTALAHQLGVPGSGLGELGPGGASMSAHTPKKVFRHLLSGDLVLLNRQPTLHKPSIMAHTARVLPGEKTIRLHYANCNTYNADFDGDEMNVHLPQNELARAEAMVIARTEEQYLVPTSGGVLRGLIQDHVDAGVWMTSKDTFFTQEDYMQLCYVALRPDGGAGARGEGNAIVEREWSVGKGRSGRIITVSPAILKPRKMWSGKQVISTILRNLTVEMPQLSMTSKSRVPAKYWGKLAQEEGTVTILAGDMLTGILDKNQFGASANGLVHGCYEVYGGKMAGKLLSVFSRLFSYYLQHDGFSCRMDDLRLTQNGNCIRKQLFVAVEETGLHVLKEFVGMVDKAGQAERAYTSADDEKAELRKRLEGVLRSDERMAALDGALKTKTNEVTSKVINTTVPDHLLRQFPHNNMQVMTVAGAKGSGVNVSQISCLLGQQELEGRRVPTMVSGKTLPSFQPFETSPRAGGYVTGRFFSGIRPQEYFFHCMAGREGLIDTAVKTSRSGYLQRCLIKHLEGLRVHYDSTVRDSDGSVVQFFYGEDGLDVMKSKSLQNFGLWAANYEIIEGRVKPKEILEKGLISIDEDIVSLMKKALRKPRKHDTVMSRYWPPRYLGATSELFAKGLREYVDKNPDNLLSEGGETSFDKARPNPFAFGAVMELKYITALAEPGEAVGLLAAQGVGEPSTQMTLNTFHLAGFGATNVTLGIPRLRELLMTASTKIKTPLMSLPILPTVTDDEALDFCKLVSRINLSHITDGVNVRETLGGKDRNTGSRRKVYVLRLNFWKRQDYAEEYDVSEYQLERVLERKFIPALEKAISMDLKKRKSRRKSGDDVVDEESEIGKPQGNFQEGGRARVGDGEGGERERADEGDAEDRANLRGRDANDMDPDDDDDGSERDEDEAEGDGDATAATRSRKQKQMASYDDDDDDGNEDDKEESGSADGFFDLEAMDEDAQEVEGERDEEGRTAEERILEKAAYVVRYRFDRANGRWCELTLKTDSGNRKLLLVALVENVIRKVVVREVRGINKVFVTRKEASDDKSRSLTAEGSNLRGMWEYPASLDLNQIYSNDIGEILRTYGVEAARAAVMREVATVFGAYGISVDKRHLSLISDSMTFEGGYKPFNRMGMSSNPAPFAQMSFETTMQFLTTATLAGDFDDLTSPSSRLVMGQVVKNGTGSFDVAVPLQASAHVPLRTKRASGKWDKESGRELVGKLLRGESIITDVEEAQ